MERDATPQRPRIGVVVGEGHPMRKGLLRFVLEGEGFLVLADVADTVELVQALAVHRPEAVVLDDGLGATAVVLTREVCPDAKLVLVWPSELAPISGDATVEPTQVLRELGPAVERACGILSPDPAPATVRTMRPRVGRMDRGSRANAGLAEILPGPGISPRRPPAENEPVVVDRDPAPILILPVSPAEEREPRP